MDFFYDKQIESYLLQFIRIFSELKIESDPDENGVRVQRRVPVKYGDMSRMVGHIIKDNNQNVVLPSPNMAAYISSLKPAPKRRNDTQFVGTMSGTEKFFNEETQQYEPKPGNKYTVYRYMPVPYDLELKLDITTPNTQTKLQILEQILTLFNPSIQLTHNENSFDWTSIQEIFLEDVNWSNRSIPVGPDLKDDIATLTFKSEIWLSIPAKVKKQTMIEHIIANLHNQTDDMQNIDDVLSSPLLLSIHVLTKDNMIDVNINSSNQVEITLLNKYGGREADLTWPNFLKKYGSLNDDTILILKTDDDVESSDGDVYGSVVLHPTDDSKLLFTVDEDTLPETTVESVNRFINAITEYPSKNLPSQQVGQRYLLLSDHTNTEEPAIENSPVWGTDLVADEFDIIEYNGTGWVVSFDGSTATVPSYMKNLYDGQHYRFDGSQWVYTYLGKYNPEYWRLENLTPPN